MKTKIQQALDLAKEVHKDQRRANGDPYFNHIDLVYRILKYWTDNSQYTHFKFSDEEELIVGALHDAYEDHTDKIALKDITTEFGDVVSFAVSALNNSEFSTYLEYLLYLKDIRGDWRILVLETKRADMIANYYDVLYNPGKNKHQMKHLKNKNEMAFYILYNENIWEQKELKLIKNGVI